MEDGKEKKSQILKIIKALAIIGIILIPSIYTTVFLGSMWDPYGNLDKLPVAVVNLDKSCDYNGKELSIGEELVKNLKENNALNFNFVDKETAQEGLDNGSYYMVITIPENFSYNATTLLEDNPQKMELQYKVNPGKNYIASKMSESAIQKITNSIENSVTEVYAETVFDKFSEIGLQLKDAADGASQINNGLKSLKDGSNTISSNLKLLYDSSLTFSDGINSYEKGISKYLSAVNEIKDGSITLKSGINTLNSKASSLSEGVNSLNIGANSLYAGLQKYTSGVDSVKDGVSKLNSNSNDLLAGANSLNNGLTSLKEGSNNLVTGLRALSASIGEDVNKENSENINKLTSSLNSFNSSGNALESNLTNIGTSLKNSSSYITELQKTIAEISSSEWFKDLDSETQNKIINNLSAPLAGLGNELTSISNQMTSAKTGFESLSNNKELIASTITNLYSGLEKVQYSLNNQIIPGADSLNNGISALKDGSDKLTYGIQSYTSGVSSLYKGTNNLASNSESLVNGAESLSNGTTALNNSVPALTDGINKLAEGSNDLSEGLIALSNNNLSLSSGINKINSASNSISEGAYKLYAGSKELSSGVSKLEEGSETLSKGLEEGSEKASTTKLTDSSKEMFASPIEGVEAFNSYIANNGSAMSAYMMCVGLWVGCLALCILFPTERDLKNGKENPKTFWPKKALKLASMAIIQAVVMVSLIRLINGLEPAYLGRTYLIAIVASLSFMAIVYFMNLLLGKIGSFILLIFMVLQLSGSAGTYPIELSDSFFNAIHNYMPFTYAVDGFRNGLATGLSIVPQALVLLGIGFVCSILSIIVVIKKNKSDRTSLSQLIEEAV